MRLSIEETTVYVYSQAPGEFVQMPGYIVDFHTSTAIFRRVGYFVCGEFKTTDAKRYGRGTQRWLKMAPAELPKLPASMRVLCESVI